MLQPRNNRFRDTYAPVAMLLGDSVATLLGLGLGFWIRYHTPLGSIGIDVPNARLMDYVPLLGLGAILLIATFANLGLYDSRFLLRRYQSLNVILKGTAFWLLAYLTVSLVLKFSPPISRLFVVIATVSVIVCLYCWRAVANAMLARHGTRERLQQRAVLLGWNASAMVLSTEIDRDPFHPFCITGVITLPGDVPPAAELHLGSAEQLERILREKPIDLLIATRMDLKRLDLRHIVETCERNYVEWKVVPAAFDIFLNGLRLQTIGRTPVLGIESLAISRLFNRLAKRLLDLVGAGVGLILSAPLVAVLALLIKRESPEGPVFFRQERIGSRHRTFTLYKLRSMRPDAAASDQTHQSTQRGDPRLLRIGAFMRRWNLDELPQFWNVLCGEMSLVGPRPERPYHVDQLSNAIPHYLPRHLVKPGMTGWAQVHGLRGETSIELRIQYDIYYIENWSMWLDVQILLLTLARWRNHVE
jgi:exopolysaccharide biosynthesis polyprenyl glycosylphosphotransferase